ncbi:hypothetical protein IFM89_001371 [Coptis chinensis]|uniref:Uncharacterized protein n=1 Tax=Coptis chinensis TaxID=261450 RepID=A0A835HJS3_9MAGN|nr:hypothetical protein IFM89_001371 [Coptis chinensis]
MGDFNAYLSYSEKQGGNRPSAEAMNAFRECVSTAHLLEVPCNGFHHTWMELQSLQQKLVREEEVLTLEKNKVTDSAGKEGTQQEQDPKSAGSSAASLSRVHEVYAEKTLAETEVEKVLQMLVRNQHKGVEEKEQPDRETPPSRWGDLAEDDEQEE